MPKPSAKKKSRFPDPAPMRREGAMDGLPSVMIVNTALKGYAATDDFPYHVWVAMGYNSTEAEQGLPTPKEERTLSSIEDALLAAVRKGSSGHYIGHTSWNGVREFHFYVDDPDEVEERLAKVAEQQHRPVQLEINEDSAWAGVDYFFDYEQ